MRVLTLSIVAGLLAMPALAVEESKKASCAVQAGIVDGAAQMRRDGRSEARTTRALTKAVEDRYQPAVPHLVAWVYTLETSALELEIGEAYAEQCLNH